MVQDVDVLDIEDLDVCEGADLERPSYSNGPRTDQVMVRDRHPVTRGRLPGAAYEPGEPHGKKRGWYCDTHSNNIYTDMSKIIKYQGADKKQKLQALVFSHPFIQLSVFACALKTLDLFEKKNILGRKFSWAFGNRPLTYEPRALAVRDKPNAQYIRLLKKISFTYVVENEGQVDAIAAGCADEAQVSVPGVYAALSRDIVAHETAHAIIDGINPYILDSIGPAGRALHEGLADLIALLIAIKSGKLHRHVMKKFHGSIIESSLLSEFAEEVGHLVTGRKEDPLRSFLNDRHVNTAGDERTYALPEKPYDRSLVLSGAIYNVVQIHHAMEKSRLIKTKYFDRHKYSDPEYSSSGEALTNVARRIRILLARAVDYLPPGEITLADYARALLEVDRNLFGEATSIAESLCKIFFERSILRTPDDLPVKVAQNGVERRGRSIREIIEQEDEIEAFIADNRGWLGVPDGADYSYERIGKITPPDAFQEFIEVTAFNDYTQAILKVHWPQEEPSGIRIQGRDVSKRCVRVGTTVVFDLTGSRVLSRLTCAQPTTSLFKSAAQRKARAAAYERRQRDTEAYFNYKLESGQISPNEVVSGYPTDELGAFSQSLREYTLHQVGEVLHIRSQGMNLHPGAPDIALYDYDPEEDEY